MADSAFLKIDRAAKHIEELNELVHQTRPFGYIVETDTETGQRTAFPTKNEAVINAMALIIGDVVHNLRSALDHAYWLIVCGTERERFFSIFRSHRPPAEREALVQFPFAKDAKSLNDALRRRFAHYAGTGFFCALRQLRPHGPPGGNDLLYLIHQVDILDKHRLLIPIGDYTVGLTAMIRQAVPDFPYAMDRIGLFNFTFKWVSRSLPPADQLGIADPSLPTVFRREIDIPVDVILHVDKKGPLRPLFPTLVALVGAAREAVILMQKEAALP
jgi:hypothetical protein